MTQNTNVTERQAWMSALSKSEPGQLQTLFETLNPEIGFEELRKTETGLVMVRGRSGGVGNQFNLGEMTVTRGAVRLESGETGLSYVPGRDKSHAKTAAVVDALMQNSDWREKAREKIIAPLQATYEEKQQQVLRQRAATRVDFFTMTRTREDKK